MFDLWTHGSHWNSTELKSNDGAVFGGEEKEKYNISPKPPSLRIQIKPNQPKTPVDFPPRKDYSYTDKSDDIEEVWLSFSWLKSLSEKISSPTPFVLEEKSITFHLHILWHLYEPEEKCLFLDQFDEREPNLVFLFGGGESIGRRKIPKLELPWVLISTSTNKKSLQSTHN